MLVPLMLAGFCCRLTTHCTRCHIWYFFSSFAFVIGWIIKLVYVEVICTS